MRDKTGKKDAAQSKQNRKAKRPHDSGTSANLNERSEADFGYDIAPGPGGRDVGEGRIVGGTDGEAGQGRALRPSEAAGRDPHVDREDIFGAVEGGRNPGGVDPAEGGEDIDSFDREDGDERPRP